MRPELLVNHIFRRVALGTRMVARAKKVKREHAQYRNLKNFYFDDVTKNKGFGVI